jgi:predicted ABC-type sugar transport system permease subunit
MNFMAVSETKPEPQDRKLPVRRLLARANVYIAFASLLVIAEIASPAFLSGNNISNMLQQVAPLGIVVIGQTLVIVVRGLDLSVGSVMATAAVAATAFNGLNGDVLPIIGVSLLIGLGTGLANGLLITKRSVPPFLATLAMWIVLEGCRYAYNGGAPSGNVPAFFRVIGAGGFHGVPVTMKTAAIAACSQACSRRLPGLFSAASSDWSTTSSAAALSSIPSSLRCSAAWRCRAGAAPSSARSREPPSWSSSPTRFFCSACPSSSSSSSRASSS